MSKAIEKFMEVVENPYGYLTKYKEQNKKKIIGCFPMSVPEEIIHAAGILPVVLWRNSEPITSGLPYIPTYHCGFCRGYVDDLVRGTLRFLDGLAFTDTCLAARGVHYSTTIHNTPSFLAHVHLSPNDGPIGRECDVDSLENFKKGLEEFSGNKVSEDSLRKSIKVYNENRSALRELYGLLRDKPGLINAKERVAAVASSMLMPKEEHTALLKTLLGELQKKEAPREKRIKVVLGGHFCHSPRFDVLELIEEMGGVVVDDDLYTGYRYIANDVKLDKDPIPALVDRYLVRTPYNPTRTYTEAKWSDWGESYVDMVKKSKAQGVITFLVKFCPPHQEWYPDVKRVLVSANVPELMIQVEHEAVSLAPVRTRIQAFFELIRGRKS